VIKKKMGVFAFLLLIELFKYQIIYFVDTLLILLLAV